MSNPYIYTPHSNGASCLLKEEKKYWISYDVSFPSAANTSHLGNIQGIGEYVSPKTSGKAPLVVLVHGMGNRSIVPCRMIARTLAAKGIASFILYLVFHNKRASELIKTKYPSLSAEEWFESYQISVIDVQQVIDWASRQAEIDQKNISVIGISFGGMISSIAMALDRRIKAGVFIVSGGNSEKMTRHSFLLRWQYKTGKEEFKRNLKAYYDYLAEVKQKGFENIPAAKNGYLTDPLTFTGYLKDRPVLMLNAFWDEMIPRVSTLDMWKAMDRPEICWYPATHASIWAWYPLMGPRIVRFLEKTAGAC
ncbi:MAG: alpha/beta fold hydrolase [Dehalococcoidales bacterium]|nr:alpha/beta fold hydrolase [Dehalococcoidales bacterium]